MITIDMPFGAHQLRAEAGGFSALAALHSNLLEHSNSEINVDCANLHWLDAHLSAPFMTVVNHARQRKNIIRLTKLADDVRLILRKNGTLISKADDDYKTTIPVTHFKLEEEVIFAQYSRKHLTRKEMPKMSSALLGKFFEGVDELFANCALHSKSRISVVAAGQFFPRSERLAFCISDGGRGIDGSLQASGIPYSSPEHAIDWAMNSNNTTRQGDIPGGLGLKLLREFIRMNGGKLIVASGGGFWSQTGVNVAKQRLRKPFPGTAVVMEIMTSDKNVYDLKSSPSPKGIW